MNTLMAWVLGRRAAPWPVLAVLLLLPAGAHAAVSGYFAVDVPSVLSGTRFQPGDIILLRGDRYSLADSLPGGISIAALDVLRKGEYLVAPATPLALGGARYDRRDIIRFSGGSASLHLSTSSLGVPASAGIDALFLTRRGALVLSFDIPVRLSGIWFEPNDLVMVTGGTPALYRDGSAAGIPASARVLAAAEDARGVLLVTFDVPTTVRSERYLVGEWVRWDPGGLSRFLAAPGWPSAAQITGLSALPAGGSRVRRTGGVLASSGQEAPGVPELGR